VDTQTRHNLKKDKFAQAAASGASWVTEHRSSVVQWAIAAVVALAIVIGGAIFWTMRSSSANAALGAAMDVYNQPLAMPGAPPDPNSFATAADRAKAANAKFTAVADSYGWMRQGKMAKYFAGITNQELGQTGTAEDQLKSVAGSWNRNLANLAKMALAGIYHQNNQDSQAIDLYNQIVARPSTTVSAAVAQLSLANLYADQGKTDQARALWAKVQDADKQGAAGQIAGEKLAGRQQ
jgi:predicted negative regulator of RcsB-dependent stress response